MPLGADAVARPATRLCGDGTPGCDIQVPDAIFDGLRPYFTEQQIVELSVLIGTYNMHTRVLQALDIPLEPTPAAT